MKRTTLQDFGLIPGKVQVWYLKRGFIPNLAQEKSLRKIADDGKDWLPDPVPIDPKRLEKTHTLLGTVGFPDGNGIDGVFLAMQGENWSPDGEANAFLEEKGIHHTSMMLGDVLVNPLGHVLLCSWRGWTILH
jgi:hypothetical protein